MPMLPFFMREICSYSDWKALSCAGIRQAEIIKGLEILDVLKSNVKITKIRYNKV